MEDFVKAPMWLDRHECSRDRDYSHPFMRVQHIKELLFSVHQKDNQLLLSELQDCLQIQTKCKKYSEVLFA